MTISIIIPAFNEEDQISKLIYYLRDHGKSAVKEIIVVDAGSTDGTIAFAESAGAGVVISPKKGRAAQMNYGASLATGDILYFIHADVLPPESFPDDIITAVENGKLAGRYQTKFVTKKWYLKFNAFFTRFDLFMCYGGDQTLFISRDTFVQTGGFDNEMRIMEDFEFTQRLRDQQIPYKIFSKGALISDRKYDNNSWWKVQKANYTIVQMYKKGASQEAMVKKYKELLDYRA